MTLSFVLRSEKMGVVLARLIDAMGSLAFLKLLSLLAPKDEVAKYLLASSLVAFMLTVSYSALDQGILRNVAEYRQQGVLSTRYSAMLGAYLCSAGVLAYLVLSLIGAWGGMGAVQGLKAPLALWLACDAVKNLNNAVASALRQRLRTAGSSLIEHGVKLLALWAAWRTGSIAASEMVLLIAAASACASAFMVIRQRDLLTRFAMADVVVPIKEALHFSWPMILWGVFGWFQNMSNRWFIEAFLDLRTVAEYGIISSIATFPVTALFGVVVIYIVPILYEKEASQPGQAKVFVRKMALSLIPVCLLMTLVAYAGNGWIVSVLASAKYADKAYCLPILTAAASLNYLGSILTYAVYAKRRVAALLVANTLPGLLGLTLGYVLVREYGFEGAVWSYAASNALTCLLYIRVFMKH